MPGWMKVLVATLFFALVGRHLVSFISSMNLGRHVYDHAPGPCRLVEGVEHGSEDMQALPDGTVLITSGLKSIFQSDAPEFRGRKGQIFAYDLKKRDKKVTALKITGDIDQERFEPHGISLWQDKKTGKVTVFVVNHGEEDERIEKFSYDAKAKTLYHLESIKDQRMIHVNDVAATSENSFYFTNYQYFSTYFLKMMEFVLMLPYGSIVYYDGVSARFVAEGLSGPNGIRVSADGKFVYVAHVGGEEIQSYKRLSDDSLRLVQKVTVHTKADNIELDADGNIWTGAHPIMWKAMEHIKDPRFPTPSQVLHIRMKEGRAVNMTEVFADSGLLLSGSTVAIYHEGAVLIGTAFHKLLMCQVLHL